MTKYRQLHCKFWNDSYITTLSPIEKLFYSYLITNEHTSLCGIYEITVPQMCFELSLDFDVIMELINKFTVDDKIIYSDITDEIAIINWFKYNLSDSPHIRKRIIKDLQGIKDISLISKLIGIDGIIENGSHINIDKVYLQELADKSIPTTVTIENLIPYIPEELFNEDFIEVFIEWYNYRKEIKKPLTKICVEAQCKALIKWQKEGMSCKDIIENSIRNSWQGLFPLNNHFGQIETTGEIPDSFKKLKVGDGFYHGKKVYRKHNNTKCYLEGNEKVLINIWDL